jgi:hypothetical protein
MRIYCICVLVARLAIFVLAHFVALKRADCGGWLASAGGAEPLAAEAVQGATLTLERVDDVHGGDCLALGVFRVRDGVANDVLEEDFEHAASLLVDEAGDTLDTASARETANGRLGYALDVIA